MKPWEFVGYRLLNDTSITALVGQRVFHGVRPAVDSQYPCVNFFEVTMSGQVFMDSQGTVQNPTFQISCRATKAGDAMNLARTVGISFHNLSGVFNTFDIAICKQKPTGQLLFEEDGTVYMVPVEIQIVFQDNTIT